MSVLKGFSSKFLKKVGNEKYVTVQDIGSGKAALDMLPKAIYPTNLVPVTPDALYSTVNDSVDKPDKQYLVYNGHNARKGDVIRFTLGDNLNVEAPVEEIIDVNTVRLGTVLDNDIQLTDEFQLMRHITLTINSSGALVTTAGPLEYIRDGSTEQVEEDTVTPANNRGLPSTMMYYKDGVLIPVSVDTGTPANTTAMPVYMTGVTGDLNITANDLNVQLTHLGANADSVRVGNGVNELGINASNEALVKDADVETALNSLIALLPASIGQKASAGSLAVVLSTEQEAMIDGIETLLTSIDGKDFATETTLASMSAKLPATLGQKASAASLAVVLSSEQEAMIDGIETLLTSIDGKDFATETTLAVVAGDTTSIDAKLASLGQKASAGSMPVVLSTEQEAMIDGIETLLTSLDGKDYATETTLAAMSAKLPASLGQKASAASLSTVLSTEQEAILSAISSGSAKLTVVDEMDDSLFDASSTNIPSSAGTPEEIVATLAADVKKIQVIEDIGEFMELRTGAGAGTFLCNLPLGGGEVEVSIASGTRVTIINKKAAAITAGNMAINFLG